MAETIFEGRNTFNPGSLLQELDRRKVHRLVFLVSDLF